MPSPAIVTRPCYSMRLLRPFLNVLAQHPAIPAGLLDPLIAQDEDERVPIDTVHELLRGALVMTGDEDLGLKAARTIEIGELGAIEYVASSASTLRGALDAIARYMKLVNDAVTFTLTVEGERAIMTLENSVQMPRAAEDFEAAAFFVAGKQRLGTTRMPGHAVHLTYAAPLDQSEHRKTFEDATLHFSQDFTGISFDRVGLELVLPSRDPRLHDVLTNHAERMLAELPKAESFVERVQTLVIAELRGGDPSADHVADLLHVSPRTLTRKLEQEGTSFKALLDDLRKRMALRYAKSTDLQLSEIALLLGFSNAAAFHRAFKRWTDETPIEYRRKRRG